MATTEGYAFRLLQPPVVPEPSVVSLCLSTLNGFFSHKCAQLLFWILQLAKWCSTAQGHGV